MLSRPNILFILADDVGWSDWSYNSESDNPNVYTPNIDKLASKGIQLKQHYMHSLCTPSRASFLTGRYHINTELTNVLTPGTPAGLPEDILTLPQVLKDQRNYSTAMVGKWHLGHAQRKQTPTGKGFESFTGIYTWDTDSYSKQMYETPWDKPLMIDWVKEFNNGTYFHYAEPNHATESISNEAIKVIKSYKDSEKPLFLYLAYTAAHSPLQPLKRHQEKCDHIPHLWRRQFCGMVVGLDEGIQNVTESAIRTFGDNLIIVVTSDNGGSPWFGGMNSPLRGSKNTPFEGGIKVPGFVVDFRNQFLKGVKYNGLMHVSDWLPTILSYAGVEEKDYPPYIDGQNFADIFQSLSANPENLELQKFSPREEMLVEMYSSDHSVFKESLEAFRLGDLKYIKGVSRDTNYYFESKEDRMNISNPKLINGIIEKINRLGDFVFGEGRFDSMRITLTHLHMQSIMTKDQREGKEETIRLYNITADPYETHNLINETWAKDAVNRIESRLDFFRRTKRKPQRVDLQTHLFYHFRNTLVPGDCSMNLDIPKDQCFFTHPWISDDTNPWEHPGLILASEYVEWRINNLIYNSIFYSFFFFLCIFGIWFFVRRKKVNPKKKSN